jgi:hypothetical protein
MFRTIKAKIQAEGAIFIQKSTTEPIICVAGGAVRLKRQKRGYVG